MLYFWNPDYSLIPNMMIDTSPWSPCSRRSPWSPWLLSSVHAIRSTGPNVSLDQPHKHENMIIWCMQLGHSFHLFHSVSYWQTVLAVDETFCGKKVFFPKKKNWNGTGYWRLQSCLGCQAVGQSCNQVFPKAASLSWCEFLKLSSLSKVTSVTNSLNHKSHQVVIIVLIVMVLVLSLS